MHRLDDERVHGRGEGEDTEAVSARRFLMVFVERLGEEPRTAKDEVFKKGLEARMDSRETVAHMNVAGSALFFVSGMSSDSQKA